MSDITPEALASVLIADDDPGLLAALGIAFRKAGYAVESAADGERGLETVGRRRFDLLVLDILMPGATGWEVLARAIERTPAGEPLPRAILMTGFNQEYVVDIRVLREEGVGAMLLKPFPAATLLDEAARLLCEAPRAALPRKSEGVKA